MSKNENTKKNQINQRKQERARPKVIASVKPLGPPPLLYRLVYGSTYSVFVCFVLMLSFLVQGVYVVHADETPVPDLVSQPPVVSETPAPVPKEVPAVVVETPAVTQATEVLPVIESSPQTPTPTPPPVTTSVSNPVEAKPLVSATNTVPVTTTVLASSTTIIGTSSENSKSLVSTSTSATTTYATTTEVTVGAPGSGGGAQSSSDDNSSNTRSSAINNSSDSPSTSTTTNEQTQEVTLSDQFSSTTLPAGPVASEAISINFSDNQLTFNKNECTEIASGSYYCIPPKDNGLEDALFSAPDSDGDLEIFLIRGGKQSQITQNLVDDAAPFYDQNSNTLVWHRLIDDRYQIISYDIETGEEEQLTFGSQNNMEPTRQGRYTVWQRWTDNNWDIIMQNGKAEEQISHSSTHDIAPYIHGTLLAWNRYTVDGEKTIEMYDISTQTYVTVDDPEGLSVSNPRMVFVYDSLHPNGDIVTKGFDMISRKFIQLDTLPRQIPEDIPKSEPTSETRALIQNKPSVKGDEAVVVDIASGPGPHPDLQANLEGNGPSSESLTIDLKSATTSTATTNNQTTFTPADLIIPAFDEVSTSSVQTE